MEILATDEWIIDGNYGSTMELRLQACDTVIFLDYSLNVCLDGIKERRGKARTDMPWIENEEDAEAVLEELTDMAGEILAEKPLADDEVVVSLEDGEVFTADNDEDAMAFIDALADEFAEELDEELHHEEAAEVPVEETPEEVKEEYGIELLPKVNKSKHYQAVIAAVSHKEFYDFDFAHFKENGAVIFDVKNFVPRDVVDARL